MQATWVIQLLGWTLIVLGIAFVIIATGLAVQRSQPNGSRRTESKGVLLLGPIPIIWGYGRKGWLIAGAIGTILFLFWLFLFL